MIPNGLIADQRVSLAAKALWAYIASKPASWVFKRDAMAAQMGISRNTLLKYTNELIKNGWLEKIQSAKAARFAPCEYHALSVHQNTVHQNTVHQNLVHQNLVRNSNTNISNTNISNTNVSDAHTKNQKIDSFKQQAKQAGRQLGLAKRDVFKFFTYWTQPGKRGLLYEDQKSFDVEARLKLWIANER